MAFLNALRCFLDFRRLPLSTLLLAPLNIVSERSGQPPLAFRFDFRFALLHYPGLPMQT
jgi:hypothetical protein